MYLTIEIEVGERLVPCLDKAREIAETLGIDVMVEVHGESMRVPHFGSFDASKELERHMAYVAFCGTNKQPNPKTDETVESETPQSIPPQPPTRTGPNR